MRNVSKVTTHKDGIGPPIRSFNYTDLVKVIFKAQRSRYSTNFVRIDTRKVGNVRGNSRVSIMNGAPQEEGDGILREGTGRVPRRDEESIGSPRALSQIKVIF